jgi:hypothetical protein
LNLTRIIRSEQSSISSTIRKPFSKFLKDWFDYYLNDAKQLEVNSQKVFSTDEFKASQTKMSTYRLSPDGLHEVWVTDEAGRFSVNLHTIGLNKSHVILQSGLKDVNRITSGKGPLLSWSAKNQLAVLYSDQGYSWFKTFQIDKSGKAKGEDKKKIANLSYLDMEMSKLYRFIKGHPQRDPNLTDSKKTELVRVILESLHKDEARLMVSLLEKKVEVRYLTVNLIKEAFPDISL